MLNCGISEITGNREINHKGAPWNTKEWINASCPRSLCAFFALVVIFSSAYPVFLSKLPYCLVYVKPWISEITGNRKINHEGAPRNTKECYSCLLSPVFVCLPHLRGQFLACIYLVFLSKLPYCFVYVKP
jgi:hypothetical protein